MPPTYYWLRPDDHLCSMSFAKAKRLTSPDSVKKLRKTKVRPSHTFSCYALSKKRKRFDNLKQGCNESVKKWHGRIKETALLCKFGDNLKEKIKERFVKGMKAGLFYNSERGLSLMSMEELLKFAIMLENTRNKEAFGNDEFEETTDDNEDSDDSKADADSEKKETKYREVHAYDCPCLKCDIIRSNDTGKPYNPDSNLPAKMIQIPVKPVRKL